MSGQALVQAGGTDLDVAGSENLSEFVTFNIAGQLFGIPVLIVQDILVPENIASIPLAPPEVRGSINLRGRIVTVVDVRTGHNGFRHVTTRDSFKDTDPSAHNFA